MYKAIWTGRHGFHILFFSWEFEQRIVGSEVWLQSEGSVTHCGCTFGWFGMCEVSLVRTKSYKQTKKSTTQEGSDFASTYTKHHAL